MNIQALALRGVVAALDRQTSASFIVPGQFYCLTDSPKVARCYGLSISNFPGVKGYVPGLMRRDDKDGLGVK